MEKKLNILILVKKIWKFPKHKPKTDLFKALEEQANIYYWHEDGHIKQIIKQIRIKPDFIFHYDIAWENRLAPKIMGLDKTDVPTGCFVIDLHWKPKERIRYFKENKIDIIFSVTKNPFLKMFPKFKDKHRWLPWSIDPQIMKDYKQKKDINLLLMGLFYIDSEERGKHPLPKKMPPKGRYAFRDAVFRNFKDREDFVFHPHPGHLVKKANNIFVNEKYAKELNRSKIFFTCGSRISTGSVAVLKYFEALACNSLLLAESNKEVEELGFIDGQHFVSCTVDNVVNKVEYYLNHDKERQQITENGYYFVHQFHTNNVRAKQMIQFIKASI